jgi:hypothetical protein
MPISGITLISAFQRLVFDVSMLGRSTFIAEIKNPKRNVD